MQYSSRGQKEYSALKEADERQSPAGFIPLVVDGAPEGDLGIRDVRVRFTNGMELSQGDGDIDELFGSRSADRSLCERQCADKIY